MLGAILLSDYNEIVHTFGNATFRRAMAKKKASCYGSTFMRSSARSRSSAMENLSNNNNNNNDDDGNNTVFSESAVNKPPPLSDTASTSGISSSSADSLYRPLPVNGTNGDDDEMSSCFETNNNADSNRIDRGGGYSPLRKLKRKRLGRRALERRKSPKMVRLT